jgi:methanogenic corrinoid protein MtbC1
VLLLRPELVSAVGADFTALDARHAVEQAESFVSVRSLRTE